MTWAFFMGTASFRSTFNAIGTRFFLAKVLKRENTKNQCLFGWFLTAAFPFKNWVFHKKPRKFLVAFHLSFSLCMHEKTIPDGWSKLQTKGKRIRNMSNFLILRYARKSISDYKAESGRGEHSQ